MGSRSRKRGRTEPSAGRGAMERGYARGRERDEQIRAELEPLAPGERPGAVTVSAITAALLALSNLVLLVAGVDVAPDGEETSGPVGGVLFAVIMGVAAWGMWNGKYWALLGFQALLALSITIAAVSLFVASNLAAVALCLGIIVPGGYLFWKNVRGLARLQMPERP